MTLKQLTENIKNVRSHSVLQIHTFKTDILFKGIIVIHIYLFKNQDFQFSILMFFLYKSQSLEISL